MNHKLPEGDLWTVKNVDRILAAVQQAYEWTFTANDSRFSKVVLARFILDMKAFVIKVSRDNSLNATTVSSISAQRNSMNARGSSSMMSL